MIQILAQGEETAREEATAQEEKTTVTLASPHVLPGERAYLTLLLASSHPKACKYLEIKG